MQMSEKYLPIKIFEKRKDYDDRSTEGGGDNREPGFVLHGEALRNHAAMLTDDLYEVRSDFREEFAKQRTLPVIMATSLKESAIAKSHRGRVVNILESDGNDNVVGVFGDRQILSVLSSEVVLDNMEEAIKKEEMATLTSSLSGMEVFKPIMARYEEGHIEYRARLFDYNDFDRNNLVRILFETFCEGNRIQIMKKIRFTADMYIYRLAVGSVDQYKKLEEFEGLYTVEKSSLVVVTLDAFSDEEMVPVRYREDGEDYPTVSV